MGKLGEVNGYVWMTLNKLKGIRGDLVWTDDQWQEWKFPQIVVALRKWTVRNPPKCDNVEDQGKQFKQLTKPPYNQHTKLPQSGSFQANQREVKRRPRVYCDQPNHSSTNCDNVTSVSERRKLLIQKQLCFNCTGPNHRAEECRCVTKCSHCRRRHHSSIWEHLWIQNTWAHVSRHWEKQCNLPAGCRWSLWYSVPCATGHRGRKLIRLSSLTWSNR